MNLRVRAAGAADAAFVADLGKRTAASSLSSIRPAPPQSVESALERLLETVEAQSHLALVAECDGARAGFVLLLDGLPDDVTSIPQGFVAYMAVEPSLRGRGVGSALVIAAEDEARRRGLPYMALMVTEENAAARSLYERAGYRTERRLLSKAL
ncbi:MAG: GNAT family N-acetyltransferase [Candidatus Tumulicola sp.]